MHLWRDSRHQGLTRLLVQAQPRQNTATSLPQRPSLARNDKGRNPLSQGAERVDEVGRKKTRWLDVNSLARGSQRHLGRYRDKHRRSLIPGHVISLRRISR